MRKRLSEFLTAEAIRDPKFVVLSGDHGYSLFDELRKARPDQFINCGITEQSMIGIAAGMAQEGFRPVIYGLAAFVPMRCLEQIKLDICYANLPVIILGDGAGLVYSYLGASHHCAEDLAALMPMPNLEIYSPGDSRQIEVSFARAKRSSGPSYIRIGKDDRPDVEHDFDFHPDASSTIVAHGSMAALGCKIAKELRQDFVSAVRLKPWAEYPPGYNGKTIVIEEHSRYGGLYSVLAQKYPNVHGICLEDKFADKCGDYQYALSEHNMNDEQIYERVKALINAT